MWVRCQGCSDSSGSCARCGGTKAVWRSEGGKGSTTKKEVSMKIIVSRFCHVCGRVTKWVVRPISKFWERFTCKDCETSHDTKTR